MATAIENTEAAIFSRVINAETGDLPEAVAQHILAMNFAERDREKANDLAAKARNGQLSEQETVELENYNLVGDLLALWHSKARLSLHQSQQRS